MNRMEALIAGIRARAADPLRSVDAAAWVRPVPIVAPPVTDADLNAAETALGFPLPPLLRRLYGEVGNGGWGPYYGLLGVPAGGAAPGGHDIVGLYRMAAAAEWPRGWVPLIGCGCGSFELCDFPRPPHPVSRVEGRARDPERPVEQALVPVAASLAERLHAWLSG